MQTEVSNIDLRELAADVSALRKQLLQEQGPKDYAHLKKVERWGRACTAAGYATAWIAPNPVSMLLLSVGNFARCVVAGFASIWKPAHYAPTIIKALRRENQRKVGENPEDD